MNTCNIASINSIETFGLVDGPGIRTVIFFNSCKLRCKFCHNPEMWQRGENNYGADDLIQKINRSKPYFRNNGGVTYSGGEPLLQIDFLIPLSKKLKEDGIHICLDTAGCGIGHYEELLKYIDIVLLDVKHTDKDKYREITGADLCEVEHFIDACNKVGVKIWIRQVIVPGIHDNYEYMTKLSKYLEHINNIERVDFLPFHRLGREKYIKLGIPYPYEDKSDMDKTKTDELYKYFLTIYDNKNLINKN